MLLTYTGARFELSCNFTEKEQPKAAGFHFDYRSKRWWTGRVDVAQKFALFADSRAKERFSRDERRIVASKAVDVNIDIPVPKGREYLPFQKAGIAYMVSRPDVLNADEMGLGKTIQACGVINYDEAIRNILVICKASHRLNWQRELERWLVRKYTGGFAYEGTFPDTEIVIMNYDIANRYRKDIDKRQWDCLISDEAHFLKNPDTQRTKAILGADYHGKAVKPPIEARRRIFLTGTPVMNRPEELWPILRVCDPEGLGSSHWTFVRRYCAAWEAPWGWDFSGASNLEELQQRLRAAIMVRRLKKDVLPELPPKRRQIIAIPPDSVRSVVNAEMDFYVRNSGIIERARADAETAQWKADRESYKIAAKQLKEAQEVLFTAMSAQRHNTAIAKIPYAITYIEDLLEEQAKVVVFAHHTDVVEAIAKHFGGKAAFMHNGVDVPARQAAVDRFQTDPNCRVIVGSIGTMGDGWTLTAASYVLFIELDWVPTNLNQAEDRLHRIGQLESVLIQHLVFDGSLDARMAERIIEKQEVIDRTLDR